MANSGTEDTVLATDPDMGTPEGAVGQTIDLPSAEPDHREAAPNVLRTKAPGERYRLGAELGRGGMGRVVEAFDVQLGRTVALKEVLPQITGTPRRFAREVQITARLEHPAIVPLYDAGVSADGRPYYVMRRVSGRPLDELIGRAKKLDERLVLLPAVLAAIDAIAHAHKRGVIHRDLKPANILVGDLGETVVIDWGLAKVIGEEDEIEGVSQISAGDSLQTQFGSVFGTPGFMSPEQARGEELGTEGDVYALGATLYQLLAGKPPHGGKSATELLASTHENKIVPLDEIAPHAPAELVTVVAKALAFDAGNRYQNAAQLGEDVRRFLAGQLVAAHRYTKREKLARFAKRNRATLAVAAIALVTVAVLGWLGITRIIAARDAAQAARDDARAQQVVAEAARDREVERAEAMIALRARSLVDTNPTEAVAVLKQIATSKKRGPEVAAIAKAAAMRGVGWALEGTLELTISLELSPDGRFVSQGTRDGSLFVWDLDRRKLLIAKQIGHDVHATWAPNNQLLVSTAEAPPAMFDPNTGAITPFATALAVNSVATSAKGERAIAIDQQKHAVVLEIEARTVRVLDPDHEVSDVHISPDGTIAALSDRKMMRAIAIADGSEIAKFDQHAPAAVALGANRIAVGFGKDVYEMKLGPGQTWSKLELEPKMVLQLTYQGPTRTDLAMLRFGDVSIWDGKRIAWATRAEDLQYTLVSSANGAMLLPTSRGVVRWFRDDLQGSFRLPMEMLHPRFAARANRSRLAIAADGMLLVYDLSRLVPEIKSSPSNRMQFVDDDTVLIGGMDPRWAWYDLEAHTTIDFEVIKYTPPLVLGNFDPTTGRVVVQGPDRVMIARKNRSDLETLIEGHDPVARVVPNGGPVVAGLADGRIMIIPDGKPAYEAVKIDGAVEVISTDANGFFAAMSARGEMVHGSIATNDVERTRITPASIMMCAADGKRTLYALDDRLFIWADGRMDELAKFSSAIVGLDILDDRVLIMLRDNSVYMIAVGTKTVSRVLPALASPVAGSYDTSMLAGIEKSDAMTMVDFPSLARWTIPIPATPFTIANLSPTAKRMATISTSSSMVYTLPQLGPDLVDELDRLTNATVDGDLLVWPWQHATIAP